MSTPSPANAAPGPFRVQLFGKLAITQLDVWLPLPTRVDARLLLAYVLIHRRRTHARAALLGVIWPDLPEDRARRALSQALWQIGRSLPNCIHADHDSVQLRADAPLWVDLAEFERLLDGRSTLTSNRASARRELEKALQLYQGDLLEGFYQDWIRDERERLKEKVYRALEGLIQLEKVAENYQRALDLALILSTADPLRETNQRELMRLYYLLNRPSAALQQFAICQRVLRSELALEPEAETIALADEIASRTSQPPVHIGPRPTAYLPMVSSGFASDGQAQSEIGDLALIGRDAIRMDLLGPVAGIFDRIGGLIVLEGDRGVGKTRLARELGRDAEWRGAQVLWGSASPSTDVNDCSALQTALAAGLTLLRFEQLRGLVEAGMWAELGPLIPDSLHAPVAAQSSDFGQIPARLSKALARLLSAWTQIAPLLIVLENLERAADSFLKTLTLLAADLRESGALVIATYSEEDAFEHPTRLALLRELSQVINVKRIKLPGLDLAGTRELVQVALKAGPVDDELALRLFQDTGGNPLFVLETLQVLSQSSRLTKSSDGERWQLAQPGGTAGDLPLPPLIESLLERCVRRLSPPAKQMLATAAVLGHYFEPAAAIGVSGLTPSAAMAALGELVQRRLILEGPRDYQFRSGQTRQMVYAGLTSAEKLWLHGRVAQHFEESRPERPEVLADQFARAELWAQAVHYLHRAADRAIHLHTYGSALGFLNRAIDLAGRAGLTKTEWVELVQARENVCDFLGRRELQQADIETLAALAQGEQLLDANWRRARWLAHHTDLNDAERELQPILKSRGLCQPPLWIKACVTLTQIRLTQGRPDEALSILDDSNVQAVLIEQSQLRAEVELARSECLQQLGQVAAARTAAENALAGFSLSGNSAGLAQVWIALSGLSLMQGNMEEARIYAQRAFDLSQALDYAQAASESACALGVVQMWTGAAHDALAFLDRALEIALGLADGNLCAQVRASRAEISLCLGNEDIVKKDANEALQFAQAAGNAALAARCQRLLAGAARLNGDVDLSGQLLDESLQALQTPDSTWAWERVRYYLDKSLWAIASGDSGIKESLARTEDLCHAHAFDGCRRLLGPLHLLASLPVGPDLSSPAQDSESSSGGMWGWLTPLANYEHFRQTESPDRSLDALEAARKAVELFLTGLPVEQQQSAWERVPEYRRIASAWRAAQPERRVVALAALSAPLGRPLKEEELLRVIWTITQPADDLIGDPVARRRHRLARLLKEAVAQGAAPTYPQLAEALKVSVRTIAGDVAALRRDLPALAIELRGGAARASQQTPRAPKARRS